MGPGGQIVKFYKINGFLFQCTSYIQHVMGVFPEPKSWILNHTQELNFLQTVDYLTTFPNIDNPLIILHFNTE